MRLSWLINYLVEVDRDGIVVKALRRKRLMQHIFTFEQNSPTHPWTDVYDLVYNSTIREVWV